MIIYNVTSKIDWSIHDQWVKWMQEEHIPEVIATGCFTHAQLLRLIETDETEGPTYAAQFFAEIKTQQDLYIEKFAPSLRQKTLKKWGNLFISFRSTMQVVN